MLRELDKALEFAEKAVRAQPGFVRGRQRLACCLAHMGREEQAREALEALLQRQPSFGLDYILATYPFRNDEDREYFMEGLRRAGMSGLEVDG